MDDEWRVYPAVVSISLSRTEACLALCECMAANHLVFWFPAPDVQQMGFTNITPGCTGFYSGLFSLCHSCRFSQCSFLSCITSYFVVFLKKISFFNFPSISSPLLCFETFAEDGVRAERERGIQLLDWVKPSPILHC